MRGLFLFIGGIVAVVICVAVTLAVYIPFQQGCGGYLKQAADANTIELAQSRVDLAVLYAEENRLTHGYTSIIYRTPGDDLGFWYQNLKAAQSELKSIPANATPLEKSNLLMKLRETLLDQNEKGTTLNVPGGITRYPHNKGYALVLTLALAALLGGFIKQITEV